MLMVHGLFTVNSWSTKVVDFDSNRKRICDFLLVINSNLGPILHRFGDMVVKRSRYLLLI